MSEPRMLDLGHGPGLEVALKEPPVMVISTAQKNDGRRKAPSDGNYTLGGGKFFINAGDPIPDGAEFVAKGELPGGQKEAPASAEEEAASDEPAKKSGKRGPSETTDATGPSETA